MPVPPAPPPTPVLLALANQTQPCIHRYPVEPLDFEPTHAEEGHDDDESVDWVECLGGSSFQKVSARFDSIFVYSFV